MNKTLYKRNAQGKPIFWNIYIEDSNIYVKHGLVGREGRKEIINTTRPLLDEASSLIQLKRKEGYKALEDLYDNAPFDLTNISALDYLNTYLPKYNTHGDGKFIPMLCKTLKDNKPFEKHTYVGQWKINGERCIVTADKSDDLFQSVKLYYRSREGVDWTDKLSYLDNILIPKLKGKILDMMIEEGIGLDGELYLPGYSINEINSFIKNTELPQHYQLQYWVYDVCIDDMRFSDRYDILLYNLIDHYPSIKTKESHISNKNQLMVLPNYEVEDIINAIDKRDWFILLGFEGIVIRDIDATYQFGGKRNNAMLKFKKIEDGYFKIVAIKEDKRGLPVFTLKNDINEETFDATINIPQDAQRKYLTVYKDTVIGKSALVEYRERSGVKEVPFHSKIIKIII